MIQLNKKLIRTFPNESLVLAKRDGVHILAIGLLYHNAPLGEYSTFKKIWGTIKKESWCIAAYENYYIITETEAFQIMLET